MQTIRTFIAINFSSFKDEISEVIRSLQPEKAKVKWVHSDKAHMTLHFFGNLTLDEIETVKNCIRNVGAIHESPLHLGLDKIGAFPNLNKPRIVWIGLKGDTENLCKIQSEIEIVLKKNKFPVEDRKFKPHLTIGRVKFLNNDTKFINQLVSFQFNFDKIVNIDEIILYKSTLTPNGAEYSVLESFPLGK